MLFLCPTHRRPSQHFAPAKSQRANSATHAYRSAARGVIAPGQAAGADAEADGASPQVAADAGGAGAATASGRCAHPTTASARPRQAASRPSGRTRPSATVERRPAWRTGARDAMRKGIAAGVGIGRILSAVRPARRTRHAGSAARPGAATSSSSKPPWLLNIAFTLPVRRRTPPAACMRVTPSPSQHRPAPRPHPVHAAAATAARRR